MWDLVHTEQEDIAGLCGPGVHRVGLSLALQPLFQRLLVTGRLLVQDHQVGRKTPTSPVGLGLEQLANQADVLCLSNVHDRDREIAGDSVGPQVGLALAIVLYSLRGRTENPIRIEHVAGQLLEAQRLIRKDPQQPQLEPGRGPGEFNRALDGQRVGVFLHQYQSGHPGLGGCQHQ